MYDLSSTKDVCFSIGIDLKIIYLEDMAVVVKAVQEHT